MKLTWIALIACMPIGLAQSQAEKISPPKFDVISVKLNKSPDLSKGLLQFLPGGRFVATDISLGEVIAAAWDIPSNSRRLTLAPGVKMLDEIYDIEAIPEKGAFPPAMTIEARMVKMRLLLRSLLEDRFELRIRREAKEQPVYVLVVGKDGPRLEKSKFQEPECGDNSPTWISNPACHWLNGGQVPGLHGESVSIAQVVNDVQNYVDRPLLDRTGLAGFYDIETEGWAPMSQQPPSLDGAQRRDDAAFNDSDRPSLFNVFEKLGLRMETQRAVVDTFVIDHIEKPSAN